MNSDNDMARREKTTNAINLVLLDLEDANKRVSDAKAELGTAEAELKKALDKRVLDAKASLGTAQVELKKVTTRYSKLRTTLVELLPAIE